MYPTRPGRLYLVLAAGALVALVMAQQQHLIKLGSGRFWTALPDALHGSWFACVTWLVLLFVKRWAKRNDVVATTALIGVSIAVGTELMQKLTGGDSEISDVFYDMVGMSAALCLWSAREKIIGSRLGISVATLLLIGSLWPIVMPTLIDRYRDSIAPELVRFDSKYLMDLLHSSSAVAVVDGPANWSIAGPVLKITLAEGETWPGVWLPDPIADWRAYSELDVDLWVVGSAPMPVTISVRLRGADHVFRQFDCAPGPCRLRLPLDGLFDRDVARVSMVVVHSLHTQAGRVVYLGRVALHE